MKRQPKTGDGLALYQACKASDMADPEIFNALGIGNTQYYLLFKQAHLDDKIKAKAARALNRTIEDIFGSKTEVTATIQPQATAPDDYKDKYIALLEKHNAVIEEKEKTNKLVFEKINEMNFNYTSLTNQFSGVLEGFGIIQKEFLELLKSQSESAEKKGSRSRVAQK